MTQQIPLTRGLVALVDDDDFASVSAHKWHAQPHGRTAYAVRYPYLNGKRVYTRLHRELLRATSAQEVDHINGDGLDNRRANLRIVTHPENGRNKRAIVGGTSRFKGVSFVARDAAFIARITVNGRTLHVKQCADEVAAALAYDDAARLHHGPFATFNFPRPGERSALLESPLQEASR